MKDAQRFVLVALAGPLRKSFCYHLPAGMPIPKPGQRLLVPFGTGRKVGFYIGCLASDSGFKTKAVLELLDSGSYFSTDLFKLCLWMAEYYFANPADCLAASLPALIKNQQKPQFIWHDLSRAELPAGDSGVAHLARPGKKISAVQLKRIKASGPGALEKLVACGAIESSWQTELPETKKELIGFDQLCETFPDDFARSMTIASFETRKTKKELINQGWSEHFITKAVRLKLIEPIYADQQRPVLDFVSGVASLQELVPTDEQREAIEIISAKVKKGFSTFLLHGITGSGKTLVYCHLARELIKLSKSMLLLTPEITLSGTTLAYFRGFFGDLVTVLHSSMTDRERLRSWEGIRAGRFPIVIGPRSALFAPMNELGLIIVDEEHDPSYKQNEPAPRFHGRDGAIMRGQKANCPVILGSATPSLESYQNALSGRYELIELKTRPAGAALPEVKLVDMRVDGIKGDQSYLSLPLKNAIASRLSKSEQVILYLNRRGFSSFVRCLQCGQVPECPRCNIKLTYHKSGRKLTCHYCDFTRFGPGSCTKCDATDFDFAGLGTQKIEERLPLLFKNARSVRFDSDSAGGRQNGYRILNQFSERKYDLLLGTQMVTKGLDVSGVTLVGVIAADFELGLPDFRANEKAFSRLVQVSGRAGRKAEPGEVIIQTFEPDQPIFAEAAAQDSRAFFDREIESRREFDYPPFTRLLRLILSSPDRARLLVATSKFSRELKLKVSEGGLKIKLLGPAPCPLEFLRGRHRQHMIIKTRQIQKLTRLMTAWEGASPRFGLPGQIRIAVDVDPVDLS